MNSHSGIPSISVVILNFNGMQWLPRCFKSLEEQTIFSRIEVIVADNASVDGSDRYAQEWLERTGKGQCVRNSTNLYFCEGNNVAAAAATGEYLLFLNFDLWLETDCLEKLYEEVTASDAGCATPFVLNYDDNTFQGGGESGLDLFGLPTTVGSPPTRTTEVFTAYGCSLLVRADLFRKIGGFPTELLMYADETDLSWRVWIAGSKVVTVPAARLHHRGSVVINPAGQEKIVESRTSETKRFLANRNGILLLMKNGQHILLFLLIPHLFLLLLEALASLVLIRRWSYVRKSYLGAVTDAFRMLPHVSEWRRRIRGFRKRSDFRMLRFLRLRPSRWDEVKRLLKFGVPKVEAN